MQGRIHVEHTPARTQIVGCWTAFNGRFGKTWSTQHRYMHISVLTSSRPLDFVQQNSLSSTSLSEKCLWPHSSVYEVQPPIVGRTLSQRDVEMWLADSRFHAPCFMITTLLAALDALRAVHEWPESQHWMADKDLWRNVGAAPKSKKDLVLRPLKMNALKSIKIKKGMDGNKWNFILSWMSFYKAFKAGQLLRLGTGSFSYVFRWQPSGRQALQTLKIVGQRSLLGSSIQTPVWTYSLHDISFIPEGKFSPGAVKSMAQTLRWNIEAIPRVIRIWEISMKHHWVRKQGARIFI